jgi:tRNA threonylcarbamoyladenosine biosynthesis protein TsaB
VALVHDGRLLGEVRLDTADVASRRLLPSAVFLLESSGVTLAQLDGLAVSVGPGSFTGLRVGLGTVQGLAFGSGRPCVGVSSLAALGSVGAGQGRPVAALMDAARGEIYCALYDPEGRELLAPRRDSPEAFFDEVPADALFVGDGAERHAARIEERFPAGCRRARPCFLAASVARLGAELLARGAGGTPDDLRPLYLREAHIRAAAPR